MEVERGHHLMSLLGIIIAVIAVALLITGGLFEAVNFLLWVGIALAIIAAIVFLIRYLGSGRTTP
jgi:hypothetical protein